VVIRLFYAPRLRKVYASLLTGYTTQQHGLGPTGLTE